MTLNYPNLKSKPPTLQYLKTHLFENIPEVSSTITTSPNNDLDSFMVYNLPFKHNVASHQIGTHQISERKDPKYPITNYVST